MSNAIGVPCRLLAVLVAVSLATPVQAVEIASTNIITAKTELSSRQILGSQRLPDNALDESRVPGNVTVLTQEDIRKAGAKTIQELLSTQLGVNSFDDIGNSFSQTVDLRGFNAQPVPATAVIVDGVRVNENDFGQVNWQLIPLENVERVEIHPGPSTLYGKNALGGVIHITTKRGGQNLAAETGLGYGSDNRKKGWAQVSDTAAGIDYLLSATKEEDNGYRQHSDASIGTVLAKLGYKIDKRSDLSISYTRADDRLQMPGSLTQAEAAQDPTQNVSRVDTVSKLDMLTYNQRQALPWDFSLALNGYLRNRQENIPLNQGRSSLSSFLANMKSQGITGQLSRDADILDRKNITTAGVEFSRNDSDSAGSATFGGFGPFPSSSFARDDSAGVFAENVFDVIPDKVVFTAGLRYDQSKVGYQDRVTPSNSGTQFFNRTNPRAGFNFNINDKISTYALYSEAFRVPTVDEITAIGPFPTSILKPVKARNYEIGGKAALRDNVSLRAAGFFEEVHDEIYPVFDPTLGFGNNINIDKTRHVGVEWGVKADHEKLVEAFFNHTFTRSTFRGDMALDKVPFGNTQTVHSGDRLPMVPEHRISAGISVHPMEGWTLSTDGLCVGGQRMLGDESNTEPELPGYCVMNLGGSYQKKGMRFFVKGYNILDHRYASRGILATNPSTFLADRFVVPAPGINFFAGVSYRFRAGEAKEPLLSAR